MQKIASPRELLAELMAIRAFIHHSEKPDRQVIASKLNELADRLAKRPRGYSFMVDWSNNMTPRDREAFLKRYTDQSDHLADRLDILIKAQTAFRDVDDLFKSMVQNGYIPTVRDSELVNLFVQTGIPYYSGGKPYLPPKSFVRQREKEMAREKKNQPTFDLMTIMHPAVSAAEIESKAIAEAKRGKKVLLGKPAFELYEDNGLWAVQQPHKSAPDTFGNLEQAAKFMRAEWIKGGHLPPPTRLAVRHALQNV